MLKSLKQKLATAVFNGVELFDDEFEQKRRKTQNMVMIAVNIANAYVVAYILVLVGIVFYLDSLNYLNFNQAITTMIAYSSVVLTGIISNTLVLRAHKKSSSSTPFIIGMIVNIFYIFFYAIFLETETYFFLFLFTKIPVSYVSLGSNRYTRFVLGLAITCALSAILWQSIWGPLLPMKTPFLTEAKPALYFVLVYITKAFAILTNIAILLSIMGSNQNYTHRTELDLQNEKKKSESLLKNILPTEVIDELKEKGSNTPVRFESASVLFTDFVGFTRIAEQMPPEEVVAELDKCFSYFDQVTEK